MPRQIGFLAKFPCLFLFLCLFLSQGLGPLHAQEPVATQTDEKIKISNFPEFGIHFLEDITIEELATAEPTPPAAEEDEPVYNFDYKNIIISLIENDNEDVIRALAEKMNPNDPEEDIQVLKEKIIKEINRVRKKGEQPVGKNKSLSSENLFDKRNDQGVVLRKADVVDVYSITVSNESQRMIDLGGDVTLYFGQNSLEADQVTVNSITKDIHGQGNVKLFINNDILYGDRIIINLKDQIGYIFNVAGLQDGIYFEGKLLRINRRGHYTIEEGWVTFSSNRDPVYRIGSEEFDTYGPSKAIFTDSVVFVHNQPFFWVPFFLRYPVTTGLELSFGETRREGYYALTKMNFETETVGKIDVNFNVFEKLGLYLGIKNVNKILSSSYTLDIVGAYYTENEVTRKKPGKLTYSYNTTPYIQSESSVRHKLEYGHTFNLTEPNSKIKSSLKFGLKNVSDPFISTTFPLTLSHFNLRKILERTDRGESLFTPSPSDTDYYNLNYNLSAPQTSLAISLAWNYAIYNDPNLVDEPIDDRYTMYLSSMTLPNINFSHGGTFDPYRSDTLKSFNFNIGYNTSLSFSGKRSFKNGTPLNTGTGILTNVEAYDLTKENYDLQMGVGFNRPFSFDLNRSSILDFNLKWFDWTITPSINYKYTRSWEGKDYTSSDNLNDDKEIRKLSYSISSGMNFNKSVATFFDMGINNGWTLNDGQTTFRHDYDDVEEGEPLKKVIEQVSSSYSFSVLMNFPSGKLKGQWGSAYSYHSMLPTVSLKLISYSVAKTTSEEKIDEGEKFALDEYTSRSFSSSLNTIHNGYGFLFLNGFDYVFSSSLSFAYNLLPDKNEDGGYRNASLFDETLWTKERISSFSGNSSWNFKYDIWNWNNSLSYIFYRQDIEDIDPLLKTYSTASSITFKNSEPVGEWFTWKSSSVGFNWNYNFQIEDYKGDSMGFSFNNTFDILQLFNLAISFSSANPNAYLYFEDKANAAGESQVNFFEDLVASFGFLGLDRQRSSLFKMGQTSVSLWHDLDDFYLSLTYLLVPITYTEGSFRGFYFDHRVSFQINLKTDRDPRGPVEAAANPLFEPIEQNFTPEGFDNE